MDNWDEALASEVMETCKFYPDFPKKGINFLDIFSATENPKVFKKIINAFNDMIVKKIGQPGVDFTHVAGLESKGFVLGPILSLGWDIPFIPIRKKGKLPGECFKQEYTLEYGTDCIEVQKTAFPPGSKVILIDDLLATGGTLAAGEAIVKKF